MKTACEVPSNRRMILEICQKRQNAALENASQCGDLEAGMRSVDDLDAPHMQSRLVDHVDGFLGGLIEGSDGLRVCLKCALGNNQCRKLG